MITKISGALVAALCMFAPVVSYASNQFCSEIAEAAESAMAARQLQTIDRGTASEMAGGHPMLRQIVATAWDTPVMSSPAEKAEIVRTFRSATLAACEKALE